jgi:hypothetical protein
LVEDCVGRSDMQSGRRLLSLIARSEVILRDPLANTGAEHTPLNIGGAKVHAAMNAREDDFVQHVIRSSVLMHRSGDRAAEAE